jgi:hypothetical protein
VQHEKQKCEELVLELCEQGHLTTRHCWQSEAVCSTCVDIRKLLEEEKKLIRKLVSFGKLLPAPTAAACTCCLLLQSLPAGV